MKTSKLSAAFIAVLLALLACQHPAVATDYGNRLGVKRGGQISYAPQGPGVLFDALDPAIRKWYVPQELFNEYKWRQWEYSNYARQKYQRYVNITNEGDYYYDLFGNFISRGWLVYNNSQTQPLQFGNSLLKSDKFSGWFSGLVIASDSRGQYHYAMTVSNQIRTTLTPMTFSKPSWDGVQFDVATDKYQGTFLYSRISAPGGASTDNNESLLTNLTTMTAGRATAQVGDFSTLGLHFVNSHQSNTLIKGFKGNPLAGALTVDQNQAISFIEVVLRDDSPDDGTGGAAYFPVGSDIIITYLDGTVDKGKDIRFEPAVQGGFVQEGFVSADGSEEIRLLYDFDTPDFVNRASGAKEDIKKVEFVLTIGNDYQVWVTSNNQRTGSEPVLLLIARADGNVQDNTNLRVLKFEYGLPTATQILGGSLEFKDLLGLNFYSEYNVSLSYRQYPNVTRTTHSISSGISGARAKPAWIMNLSKIAFPWFFFGEAYSMDPLYNTRTFVTGANGAINYGDERRNVVELVDDNDDQDRIPDLVRADSQVGDRRLFPGWDENYDFISDYNQNDNLTITNNLPDYDEPFLRHNVERPDFLFGVDMNNNLWVDRFENDEQPDYPYPKDHRGFNVYGGYHFTPETRLSIGHVRESLISSDQRNHTSYIIFTLDKRTPTWGRFRFMEMGKLAKDDIPNDLLQWSPDNTLRDGELQKLVDPLLAQDTWVNTFWLGHDFNYYLLRLSNYVNWEYFNQRDDDSERDIDYFFGIVNKASYRHHLGTVWLEPRWKSEFRHQTIGLFAQGKDRVLSEIFGLLVGSKVLSRTALEAGVEYSVVNDMLVDSRDFTGWALAFQVTNVSAYLGYSITAQVGMKLDTRDFKGQERDTLTQGFVTVFAGLGNN
jgi:hypothetical protein